MQILQSVLAMNALLLSINKNKLYIIHVPFLVFSAYINARIPIVVLILGIVFVIVKSKVRFHTIIL